MGYVVHCIVIFVTFYVTLAVGDSYDDKLNYDLHGSPKIGVKCAVEGVGIHLFRIRCFHR